MNLASTSGMKGAATATSYSASKWAVRGTPVLAGGAAAARHKGHLHLSFGGADDLRGKFGRNNPNKLYAADIADTIMAALSMPRRA